ncbi:hypothetical protein TPHA_0I02910 [Tetrapisispora phaffii CBS 4417]|uniref:VanZ-like domain-containing protein n=1 Tax=Tetrapisispora phaffii (strain ATCC 24235 / CBS 4417 / NBRC 1672 / NRRL Y-8282 / UCD 70-5) TaxID=1071381 RepID=G8BY14_TETPH|nr:hypothetical protein TPHA_0I02910 [Tetrapisispora phaffii CBS 4417]CCE64792.1 hypothetical protein TPHA_0I02910 [Tetrapisispora phaffii CBS 4417]
MTSSSDALVTFEPNGIPVRKKYLISLFSQFCLLFYILGIAVNSKLTFITSDHDKVAHFTVFLLESYLFVKCFEMKIIATLKWKKFTSRAKDQESLRDITYSTIMINKYQVGFVFCSIGVSVGSEFMQFILSRGRRSFDPMDMGFNFMGSLLGLSIAFLQER